MLLEDAALAPHVRGPSCGFPSAVTHCEAQRVCGAESMSPWRCPPPQAIFQTPGTL